MSKCKKTPKPRCRCYINLKYYAKVARTGQGTFRGYKPCPVHNKDEGNKDRQGIQG